MKPHVTMQAPVPCKGLSPTAVAAGAAAVACCRLGITAGAAGDAVAAAVSWAEAAQVVEAAPPAAVPGAAKTWARTSARGLNRKARAARAASRATGSTSPAESTGVGTGSEHEASEMDLVEALRARRALLRAGGLPWSSVGKDELVLAA